MVYYYCFSFAPIHAIKDKRTAPTRKKTQTNNVIYGLLIDRGQIQKYDFYRLPNELSQSERDIFTFQKIEFIRLYVQITREVFVRGIYVPVLVIRAKKHKPRNIFYTYFLRTVLGNCRLQLLRVKKRTGPNKMKIITIQPGSQRN